MFGLCTNDSYTFVQDFVWLCREAEFLSGLSHDVAHHSEYGDTVVSWCKILNRVQASLDSVSYILSDLVVSRGRFLDLHMYPYPRGSVCISRTYVPVLL